MTPFQLAFSIAVGEEGGFSSDPKDPGNWTGGKVGVGQLKGTKYGISAASFPNLDIANLTLEDAQGIYEPRYWQAERCGQLPVPLAICVFDCAINQGADTATRLLQHALQVTVDGCIGQETLAAVERYGTQRACAMFMAERALRYMNTKGFDDPSTPQQGDGRYSHGWLTRTYNVMAEAWKAR